MNRDFHHVDSIVTHALRAHFSNGVLFMPCVRSVPHRLDSLSPDLSPAIESTYQLLSGVCPLAFRDSARYSLSSHRCQGCRKYQGVEGLHWVPSLLGHVPAHQQLRSRYSGAVDHVRVVFIHPRRKVILSHSSYVGRALRGCYVFLEAGCVAKLASP